MKKECDNCGVKMNDQEWILWPPDKSPYYACSKSCTQSIVRHHRD